MALVESYNNYIDTLIAFSVKPDGEIEWAFVFEQVVGTRVGSWIPLELIRIIRRKFLHVLLTSSCNDEKTIFRFFEFYSRWLRLGKEFGFECFGLYKFWALQPFREDFVRWAVSSQDSTEWIAMVSNDWRFMVALLKYGLWDKRVENEEHKLKEDFVRLSFFVRRFYGLYLREEAYRITLKRGKFRDVQGELLGDSRRGFRRLTLIARTLTAALMHQTNHPAAERYTKCLEVYFSAVSDPMVSADEVENIMLFLYGEEDRQVVDSIVQGWIDLFGSRPYTPRSMVHLCRGTVRNALLQNKSARLLPNRVAKLPIPGDLKDYILCVPKQEFSTFKKRKHK